MFILKVQKNGQDIDEKILFEDKEFWVGRSPNNDMALKSSYGISRKHFKIYKTEDDVWKIENISPLGGLKFQNQDVSEKDLSPGDSFSLGNYYFHFLQKENINSQAQEDTPQEDVHMNPSEEEGEQPLSLDQSASHKSSSSEENKELQHDDPSQDPGFQEISQSADKKLEKNQATTENSLELNIEEDARQDSSSSLMSLSENSPPDSPTNNHSIEDAPTVVTAANSQLKPVLVISLAEDEEDQIAELSQGHQWKIGRDPSCEICIEDINISRTHFEILKQGNHFFITDLGSSNGTTLDGNLLKPRKSHPLESGSVISILDIEIFFEIINPKIKKQNAELPALLPTPSPSMPPNTPDPAPFKESLPAPHAPQVMPNVIMGDTILTQLPATSSSRKRMIMIGCGLAAIIGSALYFNSNKIKPSTDEDQPLTNTANLDPFQELDPDTQAQIEENYKVAQQLYNQRKFENCSDKLTSIHEILPFYDQSKQLEILCKNGAENVRNEKEIERRNKAQVEIEKKIAQNIEECKTNFDSFTSVEDIKQCLAFSIENNPENLDITNMISQFETKQEELKQQEQAAIARRKKINTEKAIYNTAKTLKDKGKTLKAIKSYKKFLKRKHPQGTGKVVATAKRELQSMESNLNAQLTTLLSSCQELTDSKKYKSAVSACTEVFTLIPNQPEAQANINRALKALRSKLKPIYEESVLNESVGQIEAAKKQWNTILSKDIEGGFYYTKAEKKLNKY